MTEKVVNFRVNEDLKNGFELVASSLDLTASQMLRAYMRDTVENYMRNNAQQKLELKPKIKKISQVKQKSVIPDSWRKK